MTKTDRLEASARVALAALLHDLGKFAERARIGEAGLKDADGNTVADLNKPLYCPNFDGRYTHVHAAYTAIALDLLEQRHRNRLPDLVGSEMSPFAPWKERNADDSLINAAARHHTPDTLLQWIIATADRLASGFEREEFDAYNRSADETVTRKNHYTARQLTLLEQIRLDDRPESLRWRYPLSPLSPRSIFPVPAEGYERDDKAAAQAEYRGLWEGFDAGLESIPEAHRHNLPLWLDHFDSLWLSFTHAIPSATAGKVKPEVSLYDHSKTTAALAVALWRFHADQNHDAAVLREQLRAQWDREREGFDESRLAWDEAKFLLIQGDFFGIQDFIFATGGETQKRAAKLLRGRSFYVSLLTELAALRLLEALGLPSTSQVVNAAGKFLIVAPNTAEVRETVKTVQGKLNEWFLQHTYGQSGIGLAALPASALDFRGGGGGDSPFREMMKRLFEQLEEAKLRRFDLCGETPALFDGFLDAFHNERRECRIDGRSPATIEKDGVWMSQLAADQIAVGHYLATQKRVLITGRSLDHRTLGLDIFGYRVNFTQGEEETGKFGSEAKNGNLRRAWDFSLPESETGALWNGYARRHINAYVPRFDDLNAWESDRYRGIENPAAFDPHPDEIKTLNHLARDDWRLEEDGRWVGQEALTTLKGDVDNLGLIFQKGLERPSFAKMAALSRQMNAFFAIYLPWLCAHGDEGGVPRFRNTYTVFAGGDDFFLIGPWLSTQRLAQRMRADFARYVAGNPDIHFSAGLSMTKPGLPIRQLARMAEEALEQAKAFVEPSPNHVEGWAGSIYPPANGGQTKSRSPTLPQGSGKHGPHRSLPGRTGVQSKNAVTCYGHPVSWLQFEELAKAERELARLAGEHRLSTGYLYGLLRLTDMATEEHLRPENALWHSYFAYRTRRMLETKIKGGEDREATERKRRELQQELAKTIVENGIKKYQQAFKIALFTHFYQRRD